ncbi:6646_t:CDS:2 [Entrophospora sp. SA101]|nr:6646_t:CDS:2 [Entrophospora sp. SA101]
MSKSYLLFKSLSSRNITIINKYYNDSLKYFYNSSTSHQPLSTIQKSMLAIKSALTAFSDPTRQDMIAILGETTSSIFLSQLRDKMLHDTTGRRILRSRPTVNTNVIDLNYLRSLPDGSFGREYLNFLEKENVTPDSRAKVKYIEDDELAYVMQRYRESHDFYHTLTNLPTSVEGELALKWFELAQTNLPMTLLSSLVGPMRLNSTERNNLYNKYVPWAIQCGSQSKLLLNVYFEECWLKNIDELRSELGIYIIK